MFIALAQRLFLVILINIRKIGCSSDTAMKNDTTYYAKITRY
jgi:hypothetical protein